MNKLMASGAFVVLVLAAFALMVGASGRRLPVGLVDLYGDTSAIRALTIEGRITSWQGQFGYTFLINDEAASIEMNVFNNSRALNDFTGPHFWLSPWHAHSFGTRPMPIGDYEVVRVQEGRWTETLVDGTRVVMPEYRIYGDVFAMETVIHNQRLYVPGLGTTPRLFNYAGAGGYLFSFIGDTPLAQFTPGFLTSSHFHFVFSSSLYRNRHLTNHLTVDDMDIFVPTGAHLFGETSVYAMHRQPQGWGYTFPQIAIAGENFIVAEQLVPITLSVGDEILGLVPFDGGFVLLITRGQKWEITRFDLQSGESITAFQPYPLSVENIYVDGYNMVFQGWRADSVIREIAAWTLDLSDGGLLVTYPSYFSLRIGSQSELSLRNHAHVHSIVMRDGIVFIAYTINGWPARWLYVVLNTETFVSAFDTNGRRIGSVQVLNGLEDDRNFAGGSWSVSPYTRNITDVTIR